MADTVHLKLKGVKQGDMKGESSQTSLGRADTIECFSFQMGVVSAYDLATGQATGRRQWEQLRIHKHYDRASPMIMQALTTNEQVDGTFTFFRPDPTGDGTMQAFYTVEFSRGRVTSWRQIVPDTTDPENKGEHPYEEVTFVFGKVVVSNQAAKTQASDDWTSSNQS
jgi:type VI secretion system secreted protein Hcp